MKLFITNVTMKHHHYDNDRMKHLWIQRQLGTEVSKKLYSTAKISTLKQHCLVLPDDIYTDCEVYATFKNRADAAWFILNTA